VASATPVSDWREAIQARVTALASREIRTLDHREMHDVASAHALRFMPQKATTDAKTRSLALGLAGRIRNVVGAKDHPAMRDLTVGEYFQFGGEVFEAGGRQAWDSPWAVVAWAEAPEASR
jgi:hypothetical protein